MVVCAICNTNFKVISNSHLRNKHKTTILEYKKLYPHSNMCDPEFIEKIENLWKTEDYRNKQYKTLVNRIHKIHQDKIGKTLEQIVHNPVEARAKMSISHVGIKQSDDTIRKRVEKFSGEKHYLWGKHQPETQRLKHSKAMKAKFISGELNGIDMMKRAKGDNFYENKFAQEHPIFLRQYRVILPINMIKRECKSRGGLRVLFVDFYDITTNTIYEIMRIPKCKDTYKENKNMRRERILKELGYNFVWVNVGDNTNDS